MYDFKQKFLNFCLKQKQKKKEKLQFVLKNLYFLPFVKKTKKLDFLFKKEKLLNVDKKTKVGNVFFVLCKKFNSDLLKNLAQGRVSNKNFITISKKKLGRVTSWYYLQNKLISWHQKLLFIRNLTAKRFTRFLLLFKHMDDSMIRRAFKFLLTKFFGKINKKRIAFDQKMTKMVISSFFYYLVKQTKQTDFISGINLYF